MKKLVGILVILSVLNFASFAQKGKGEGKNLVVPGAVKTALSKKYPQAKKVTWETEKGNYEANWGGRSGEDNSVQFTPSGEFIEIVEAISVHQLPKPIIAYVNEHYQGAKINEAGKVTNARGIVTYEAEINRKDLIFDEKGYPVKKD